MGKLSFPTCQVRVSRFYQGYLLLLLVLLLPTASSRSQWVLPDLNRKFQITVTQIRGVWLRSIYKLRQKSDGSGNPTV